MTTRSGAAGNGPWPSDPVEAKKHIGTRSSDSPVQSSASLLSTGTRTRRNFLAVIGAVTVAGCAHGGSSKQSSTDSPSPTPDTWEIEPVEHDRLVGAHYYPWYGPSFGAEGIEPGNWLEMVPGRPVLGEYDSRDEDVINQHITWAREHGINWFSVTWKPESDREAVFNDHVLEAELADRMNWSVLYDTIGSATDGSNEGGEFTLRDGMVDFDRPENREALRSHFQRLDDQYFDMPNYVRIDDRPVVYVYSSMKVTGAAEQAYAEAKASIDTEPYLIASALGAGGGPGFIHTVERDWMNEFDAVSEYGVYDRDVAANGEYADFVEYVNRATKEWLLAADHADLDFIPNIMPGMNDTLVPGRDRPPIHRDADGFKEMCRTVRDRMDPDLDAALITSFNEWPEFTSVEPAESYGTTYLEIVRDELATTPAEPMDVTAYPMLQLRYGRTLTPPAEPELEFAMQLGELALTDDAGETVRTYNVGVPENEPYLLEGAYGPPKDDGPLGTWRWLGGPTQQSTIYLDPECAEAASADLYGMAPSFADGPVSSDVYVNGERTDSVELAPEPSTYTVSLQR